MLSLGLDQTVRSVVDAVSFVPVTTNSPPANDSFDSHLSRSSDSPAPPSAPRVKANQDEGREDDAPERDEVVATLVSSNSVQQPETKPADDNDEVETSPEAKEAEQTAESESVDAKAASTEVRQKSLELRARVANQPQATSDESAQANSAEAEAKAPTTEDPVQLTKVPDAIDELEFIVSQEKSQPSETVDSKNAQTIETPNPTGEVEMKSDLLPLSTASEAEAASSAKNPRVPSSKSEPRRGKASAIDTSQPRSVAAPAIVPVASDAVVAEASKLADEAAPSRSSDRKDVALPKPVTAAGDPVSTANSTATNRLVQHLSGGAEDRAAKANALAGPEQSRFVDRVARAFRAAENRQGVVKLRLHPPELGSLRIELRMQNGAMTAKLEAETPMTQSLLIEHAYALRDRLSEQGIRVERFDVDLVDRRAMDQSGGFQERSSRDQNPSGNAREQQPEAEALRPAVASASSAPSGKINVIV